MPSQSRSRLLFLLILSAVFVASFFKIADLDFWWHLKTGEIIVQQKAFPHHDIYSFTAFGREYIDHEWLFQVLQYLVYDSLGPLGIILFKTLILVLIYWISARFLLKNGTPNVVAAGVLLLSISGARARFIERPEIFTVLLLLSTYVIIDAYLKGASRKSLLWILPITVIWSNLHAAVILGLVLQAIVLAAIIFEKIIRRNYPVFYDAGRDQIITLGILLVVSLFLTGFNPYGYRILKVPFELTAIIDSGILHNQEWQHPSIQNLPFFYVCLITALLFHAINFRKLHIVNFALTAFFGYISLKYMRNVGIFCILMPVLIAPYLAALADKNNIRRLIFAAGSAAIIIAFATNSIFEFGIGKASYFPDKIVDFTKTNNLKGHMINSYGFGGYFIWSLFPERKIFIDGRNEVYLSLLEKLHGTVADSRKWKAILDEYQIEYALLNYVDDLEVVTVMSSKNTSSITYAPFTSTHFPRINWALIYWDDNGMILIKRNGVNRELLSKEYSWVFPEGKYGKQSYQKLLLQSGKLEKDKAIAELQRKLKEEARCGRARRLLTELQGVE
jgi:hypothetical protein